MACRVLLALAMFQPDPAALLPLYRQALERREAQFGADHPKVARSASDLGLYLKRLGDREGALRHLRRALSIDEKALDAADPVLASDLENIASLVEPAEAAALLERASKCKDDAVAARALGSLAAVRERLGDVPAARESYRRALQKEESASGANHPRVAVRLNDLALVLEPKAAEALLRRALAIQKTALGAAHPETAITLNNLANALLATGHAAEAEQTQRRALAALEAAFGRDHPRVATGSSNLADILRTRGDAAGAKALYRRALAIDEQAYGPEHPEVAADLENLAGLLAETGQTAEARRLERRAAAIKAAQ
jgi:tetratricopeptide (TPR) repeat protein